MPAPAKITFSAAAKKAANDELLLLLDAGSSNAKIRLFSNADVLIAEIPLDDPAGTVSATTGVLTLAVDGTDTALVTALCTYAAITDSDNTAHVTLPVKEGVAASSGFVVLNSAMIFEGVTVSVTNAVIE